MKSLHIRITLLAAAIALVVAAPTGAGWNEGGGEQEEALTLTPNLENGMEVYEVCSACHLPEGWGMDDGTCLLYTSDAADDSIRV